MSEMLTKAAVIGNVQNWPAEWITEWDILVGAHGCEFQSSTILRVLESQWQGRQNPMHVTIRNGDNQLTGLVPAYLVESCPRLDYYRRVLSNGQQAEPVLLSHALLGWYGFPIGGD